MRLEVGLRVLGFVVAGLGTCAAVPAATWRLLDRIGWRLARLRDWLLRRREGRAVGSVAVSGSAAGTGTATGGAVALSGAGTLSLEGRLAALEARLAEVGQAQQKTAADLAREVQERTRSIADVRAYAESKVTEVRQTIVSQQRQDEEVNASALVVILGGAFVSTFPDLLDNYLTLAYLVCCGGVALALWAIVILDLGRREP